MAKGIWENLGKLYQVKGVSSQVYLKEQFHTLRMKEGTKNSDHLSVLNGSFLYKRLLELRLMMKIRQ